MGKARTFSNEGEEANYLKESEDEIYSSTQQNSYNLGSTTFSDQSGIGNFAQSGTDQRKANLTGALFRGNIGFLLQTALLDVSDNTINLLFDENGDAVSDVSSDRIVTISGGGNTSDLEIILGAQRPGQRLILYNIDGNTITIKDASAATSPTDSNLIHNPGLLDYIVSGFDSVALTYDSDLSQWRIMGAVGTGGGTGYNLIQDEGSSLTQRTTMNFIGTAVTAVDNPGQTRTDITINTGTGTIPSGTAENQHLEWDNSGLTWETVDFLTMGSTGPFASDGLIRYANNQIMLSSRNAADDGDIEIKVTSADKFIFDFDGAVPLEISSDEIDVKTVDIINIDRAKFVQNSGSMIPSDATGILLNSNSQFQFNTADTSDFTFTFDNNDPSFVIDRDTSDNDNTLVSLLSNETDINSASFLNIVKTFPTPISLQEIGHLNFIAGNNAGSTLFEYASIIGKIEDNSSGSIYGSMIFNATVNDSITPFVILNNVSNGIIEALRDVTLVNTTSNPVLTLFRDQVGVTDNFLGNIVFKGQTASGGDFTYSAISSTISDSTLGQEDSIITLNTTNDGLFGNVQLTVNADSSQILRFASSSPAATFNSPIFEFLATTLSAPATATVQRIGEINFEATTNDGGGVGAVETFAQMIVDQEESDINNESASMRFRLRDQTGVAGSIKTYLQFNDTSNGVIEALKNLDMSSNEITGVQNIFTNNDAGNNVLGASVVSPNPGGWEIFLHNRITWDTDFDTYIEFDTDGIDIVSDDDLILVAGDDYILSVSGTANEIITASTGKNIFVSGTLKSTIQDNAYILQNGVDFFMLSQSNIFLNQGFMEFESLGGTPVTPSGSNGRMYADIDPETFAVTPYWIDSQGLVTSMIETGGGSGSGGGGTSIVKKEDTARDLSPTLEADPELVFQTPRNTLYYIEVNVRYLSPGTQIKFAIEGGSDMTYRIVEENGLNTTAIKDWSPGGGSNDEFIDFASTAGSDADTDSHSAVFYAIVQVNNDNEDIAVSWSQSNNNFQDTILFKGSMMRVFQEGVSGGSGNGVVEQVSVTGVDTSHIFFGNDNWAGELGITVPTSNSGQIYFYTLTSADFPANTIPGFNIDSYGCFVNAVISNTGSEQTYVQLFYNGSPRGSIDSIGTNPSTWTFAFRNVFLQDTQDSMKVGDTIGIMVYADDALQELENFTVWIHPGKMTVISKHMTVNTIGGEGNLVAADPPSVSVPTQGGADFIIYGYNGPNVLYTDRTNLEEEAFNAFFGDQLYLNSVSNSVSVTTVNRCIKPEMAFFTKYTNVE